MSTAPAQRAAVVGLVLLALACAKNSEPPSIPLPDMRGAEPVVIEAVEAAREKVRGDIRSARAWGELGYRLAAHQWSGEAAECYAQAERLDPGEFLWPYLLGLTLSKSEPEAGAEALERALAIDDGYAPAHVHYAQALVEAGRFEEAREHFERASRLDAASAHAELGLGQLALSDRRLEEAREHLRRAIERDPELRQSHEAMAQVLLALGQREEAERHAGISQNLPPLTQVNDPRVRELALEPVGSKGHNEVGKLLMNAGKYEEAIPHFERSIELKPDAAEPHYHLGTILARTGKPREAIELLEKAVRLRPNLAVAHVNLGSVLAQQGLEQRAEEHFREALRTKPDDPEALYNLGALLAGQGRLDEAEEQLRQAAGSAPEDADVRFALGSLLESRGRAVEAVEQYSEAARLRPNWPRPLQRLAWLYATSADERVRQGNEAVRLAELWCRATGNQDPAGLDTLAAAYAEVGRFEEAVSTARQAVALATSAGLPDLAGAARGRLRLYERGMPARE